MCLYRRQVTVERGVAGEGNGGKGQRVHEKRDHASQFRMAARVKTGSRGERKFGQGRGRRRRQQNEEKPLNKKRCERGPGRLLIGNKPIRFEKKKLNKGVAGRITTKKKREGKQWGGEKRQQERAGDGDIMVAEVRLSRARSTWLALSEKKIRVGKRGIEKSASARKTCGNTGTLIR